MAKDALDAILDGDVEGLEDDLDGEVLPTVDDMKALEAKLEAVEKEKHGMLSTIKSERSKRQTAANELAELRGTVNGILQSQRKPAQQEADLDDSLKAAVTYTDDGDGFVELDEAVKPMFDKLTNEISELKNYIAQSNQAIEADARGNQIIAGIVGEKPEYITANAKYKSAHKWLDDRVTQWQNENGVQRPISGGEALDYVFAEDDGGFNEAFPGMNISDVLLAEDSQHQFRTMLENVAKGSTPELKKPDSRFQKVLNKPSGLGDAANAKAEVSVVEKAGSLASTDIVDLSDAAIKQLEAAMAREEKAEGITW